MSKFIRNTSSKTVRTSIVLRCIPLLLLSVMMVCSLPAYAQYSFQVVIPPGALSAQTFGINNNGQVAGTADGVLFSFIYDIKKDKYTTISTEFAALEINNSGVMVGDVDGVCAIRDKKGNVTTFFPPSNFDYPECQARGVNSKGMVSGFEVDEGPLADPADDVWLGFVYDPKKGTYEEFLPSPQTIAHAINDTGQIAGSVYLDVGDAYVGSPEGPYGFLREKNGSVKYFAISQSVPGESRARGISESGLVTGWYVDPDNFEFKSYVTTLSKGQEFEEITLTDDQVVYQKPCNPDVPPSPGLGYDFFTDMTASQVRNDGVVVGSCVDYYYNGATNDLIVYRYGFIATPE